MFGYIFETINKKTNEKYIGKRYAVSFDKNYFGEENNDALAIAIEKYGRPSFEVKMIMPYETQAEVDEAFKAVDVKPAKKVIVEENQEVKEVKQPAPRKKRKSEE